MKIRNGFVSNSSSSSFVVKGFVIPKEDINFDKLTNKILEKYPQLETDYMISLKEAEYFDEYEYAYELMSNMRRLNLYVAENEEDGAPSNSVLVGKLLQDTEYELRDMIIDCNIDDELKEIKEILDKTTNTPLECKIVVGTRMC